MSQDNLLSLVAGIVAISYGLIQLKLYRDRNKNNNWRLFYQAAIDLRTDIQHPYLQF